MATLNKNYNKLQGAYLFSEITKRVKNFVEKNPYRNYKTWYW